MSSHFNSNDLDELFSGNKVAGLKHVTTGDFIETFGSLTSEMIFLDKTTGKYHRCYITKYRNTYDETEYQFSEDCEYVVQKEIKIKQWVPVNE